MKARKNSSAIAAIAACLGGAFLANAQSNVLTNGDFSKLDKDGKPEGWSLTAMAAAQKEGDNSFVRLRSDEPKQYQSVGQTVEVKPDWEKLRVGLKIRVNKINDDPNRKPGEVPRAMLVFMDIDGKKNHRPMCHLAAGTTNGQWIERWEEIAVLPDSKTVEVVADLPGCVGEVDVDDIQLIPNPKAGIPLSALDTIGKFEFPRVINRKSTPPGWNVPYDILTSENPAICLMEEEGAKFVRITNSDPAKSTTMEQYFALDPSWKKIKVSAKIRAKELKPGAENYQDARVMMVFIDDKGKMVGGYGAVPNVREDQDWKEKSAVREVPEGAKAVKLQVGLINSTGTADFDDIKITGE